MYNTFLYNLLKNPLINDKVSARKGSLSASENAKLKSILVKSLIMAAVFTVISLLAFIILKFLHLNQKSIIIFTGVSILVCIAVIIIFMKSTSKYMFLGYIYIFFSACLFAGLAFINIYTDFITVKFITDTYIVLIVTIYITATGIVKYSNKYNQLFSSTVITYIISLCLYALILLIMYKSGALAVIYSGNITAYILSDIIIIFLASTTYVINMELIVKSISNNISRKKQTYLAFLLVFWLLWFIIIFLKYIINKK